jgi:hypothetical protein
MAIPTNKIREIQRLIAILRTKRISKSEAVYILDELEYAFRSIVEQREVKPTTSTFQELADQLNGLVESLVSLSKQPENESVVTNIATQAIVLLGKNKMSLVDTTRDKQLLEQLEKSDRTKRLLARFARR